MLRLLGTGLASATKKVFQNVSYVSLCPSLQTGIWAEQVENLPMEAREQQYPSLTLLSKPIPAIVDSSQIRTEDWEPESLTKALSLLERPGIEVDLATYSSLLQLCKAAKALSDGSHVHKHIIKTGHEQSIVLRNLLVQMYCACGALEYAVALFVRMHQRDPSTWNAMIKALTLGGQGNEAIWLFIQMLQEGVLTDKFIFASILSACASTAALFEGKRVHAYISGSILRTDIIVGTALVNMYSKCGSLEDARSMFDEIVDRDCTVLWNVMIAAYVKSGLAKDALHLFHQMQQRRIKPSNLTVLNVLSACVIQADLAEAKRIHALVMDSGCEISELMSASLICTYSKCGSLEEAQNVFDTSPFKRCVSLWNALIAAYVQHEQDKDALELFDQMQQEKVSTDEATFVSILEVCTHLDTLALGERIHGRLIAKGFESSVEVGVALVNMYGQYGNLEKALRIFSKLPKPDIHLWNVMIAAYARHGQEKNFLQWFAQMMQEGLLPDKVTYKHIVEACVRGSDLTIGKRMHVHIAGSGLTSQVDIGTALVNMYGQCSKLENAWNVFEKTSERNIALWNAMISLGPWSKQGKDKTLFLFEDMQQEGVMPDELTITALLEACARQSNLLEGKQMHARIANLCESELVGTGLVNMYGRCGRLEEAGRLFDIIPRQSAITWFTMLSLCLQCGQAQQVLKLQELMQGEGVMPNKAIYITFLDACARQPDLGRGKKIHARLVGSPCDLDVAMGNAIVNMYAVCGCLDDARRTLDKMPNPNEATFISILSACAHRGALVEGRRVHARIKGSIFKSDAVLGVALINMYAKCGSLESARAVFDKFPVRNFDLWNALLMAFAQHGHGKDALQVFQRMREEGVRPDRATFASLLLACCHAGLLEEGCHAYVSMSKDYGFTPDLDHCNLLISLLGRAGRLDDAEGLINNMPLKPNVKSWMALLRACWKWVDVERGERAAEQVIKQDPNNMMPYTMLSNIYAAAGREHDVERVINRMKNRGLKRQQGCSSIEVMGRVHEFLVNDQSHPKREKIYAEAERLVRQMKSEGFVPDSKLVLHGLEEEHRLGNHSEKLALAFGLISTTPGTPLFISKNLRMCPDCHSESKFLSRILHRDIIVRDAHCFHKMKDGVCSCSDYW